MEQPAAVVPEPDRDFDPLPVQLRDEGAQVLVRRPSAQRTVTVETRVSVSVVSREGQDKPRIAILHDDDAFQAFEAWKRPRERAQIRAGPRGAARHLAQGQAGRAVPTEHPAQQGAHQVVGWSCNPHRIWLVPCSGGDLLSSTRGTRITGPYRMADHARVE
jgi:hypothetical protein